MTPAILVGTRKGLFVLRGDDARRDWALEGPYLSGWDVFHAMKDDGSIFAEDHELTLEKTWHVEPGPNGTLWLGGAPGVLFSSADRGQSWEPLTSLIDHPTRERWNPGAGGMCTHSIQFDPANDKTMYVGISAAGVFRSEDAGDSWTPTNKGTAADFMADDPFPEVGQCVHKVLVHPAKTDRLWQQNHCGVYRTDDRGENWERLEDNGLPSSFGFPIAIHHRDPDMAFVIPEDSARGSAGEVGGGDRVTSGGRLGVYRTQDGGSSWELASNGLPEHAWVEVLREGMSSDRLDPVGIYFGTKSGSVFVSPNEGDEWIEAARHLPAVLSVEYAEW